MLFTPVTPGGPTNPIGIVVDILGFIGSLFGLGSGSTKTLQTAINNTWANLVFTTAFLYNAVGNLTEFIKKLLRTIVGGLAHVISDVLHGHLLRALQDIQRLLHALHNLFLPLITWLRKLQALQRQQQMLAMRRILNLIQRVRKILVPLRILHVKFAQKLDGWLAGIEGRIITRELAIVSKTNEIISWIDLITHPDGGLRGPAVLAGIGQFTSALLGAIAAAGVGNVFPARSRFYRDAIPSAPFSTWQAPAFKTAEHSPSHFEQLGAGILHVYERARAEVKP